MGNRSILLYNLFPRNNWKEVTRSLLATVPHDEIAVHVALPWYAIAKRPFIACHLRQYPKITRIFYSINSRRKGESVGFEKLRRRIDFSPYAVATYIHSKCKDAIKGVGWHSWPIEHIPGNNYLKGKRTE